MERFSSLFTRAFLPSKVMFFFLVALLKGQTAFAGSESIGKILKNNEISRLDQINQEWTNDFDRISLEDKIKTYNNTLNQLNFLNTVISNNEVIINDNISIFKSMILTGHYDEDLSSILKSKSLEQKLNISQKDELEQQVLILDGEIENLRVKLKVINETKNKKIIALYDDIKNRIISDAQLEIDETFKGTAFCDEFQSIRTCLKSQKQAMQEKFKHQIDIPLEIKLNSFIVTDATQNMAGDLSYQASVTYSLNYNKVADNYIRDYLGLNKFTFILSSNHNATVYFINNEKVGTGKSVSLSGDYAGVYNVRAEYKDKSQSMKINFMPNQTYFFPFKQTVPYNLKKKVEMAKKKVITSNKQHIFVTSFDEEEKTVLRLDKAHALDFCEKRLSSFPATNAEYNYLNERGFLIQHAYWNHEGELYQEHLKNGKSSAYFHPIICVIDLLQRTPILSMDNHHLAP